MADETVANLTGMLTGISELVFNAADDAAKAATGNKSAATRLRKTMMEVKSKAQAIRKASFREAPETEGSK